MRILKQCGLSADANTLYISSVYIQFFFIFRCGKLSTGPYSFTQGTSTGPCSFTQGTSTLTEGFLPFYYPGIPVKKFVDPGISHDVKFFNETVKKTHKIM